MSEKAEKEEKAEKAKKEEKAGRTRRAPDSDSIRLAVFFCGCDMAFGWVAVVTMHRHGIELCFFFTGARCYGRHHISRASKIYSKLIEIKLRAFQIEPDVLGHPLPCL